MAGDDLIKQESEDIKIEEVFSVKHEETEEQTGAKPRTEQIHKSRGQTSKDCYICRRKIGVASKTCHHCSAKQPYKQKLEKKKEQLSQEWIDRQKKNSSVNKLYDATNLLLHKWALLERFPVLLLARRGSSGFSAECFCPWRTDTEHTHEAFLTIQRLYESLLNGEYPVHATFSHISLLINASFIDWRINLKRQVLPTAHTFAELILPHLRFKKML